MTLNVETGTGAADSNSYIDVAYADDYHDARGNTDWTDASSSPDQGKPAALIRATAAVEAIIRGRLGGSKLNGRDQALLFPRSGMEDADGEDIAEDEIPTELKDAVAEAAIRELADPGSMMPDLDRGGQISSLKAGSVSISYFASASARTTYTIIDGLLAGLLGAATATFVGTTVRG